MFQIEEETLIVQYVHDEKEDDAPIEVSTEDTIDEELKRFNKVTLLQQLHSSKTLGVCAQSWWMKKWQGGQ
jgi:hypothetical protein